MKAYVYAVDILAGNIKERFGLIGKICICGGMYTAAVGLTDGGYACDPVLTPSGELA
jgi:hypothetical protein